MPTATAFKILLVMDSDDEDVDGLVDSVDPNQGGTRAWCHGIVIWTTRHPTTR